MNLSIRDYQKEDWDRIAEIHDVARLDELRGSVNLGAFLTLEQTAENEGLFDAKLKVCLSDETILGFIAYSPEEITWMYVDPKHYRKGVGAFMMEHALAECNEKVVLEVLSENQRGIRFYEKFGFVKGELWKGKLEGNESYPAAGYEMTLEKNPFYRK